MKHYYKDSHCTIYNCDLRDVLVGLPPVDLVFTSPPYWNQRDYGAEKFDWVESVAEPLPMLNMTEKGQILVNLGLLHIAGEVFPYWDFLIKEMKRYDWRYYGQYVWHQGEGLPGEFNGRLAPNFEFIFHFNKRMVKINKTEPCKSVGRKSTDTKTFSQRDHYKNGYSLGNTEVQDKKISNSIISIQRQVDMTGIEMEHPAVFPLGLPKKIISIWPCETILDPFMGSGTTLRAAKDLNRKCIGIELEEKYCEIAVQRLKQETLQF